MIILSLHINIKRAVGIYGKVLDMEGMVTTMKKIKATKATGQTNQETSKEKKKKLMIFSGIVAAVLVLSFVFMVVEASQKYKLHIVNHTSKNITQLQLLFSSDEVNYTSDVFFDSAIAAGEEINTEFPRLPLMGTNSGLISKTYFEGEEGILNDNGLFFTNFSGKITIEFTEDEAGVITMFVKAKEGKGKLSTFCDDDQVMEFAEK
ncbi:hypothetical protein [Lachnoclostridium sp.]|uniref:hypothetical protein n=1 Tax=Lachnoclostridium sp. TaxID=2028282 RepID=UPI00289EFAA7|nr:hypothetical protein [Lachnoclostridium sp.]